MKRSLQPLRYPSLQIRYPSFQTRDGREKGNPLSLVSNEGWQRKGESVIPRFKRGMADYQRIANPPEQVKNEK